MFVFFGIFRVFCSWTDLFTIIYWEILLSQSKVIELCLLKRQQDLTILTYIGYFTYGDYFLSKIKDGPKICFYYRDLSQSSCLALDKSQWTPRHCQLSFGFAKPELTVILKKSFHFSEEFLHDYTGHTSIFLTPSNQ